MKRLTDIFLLLCLVLAAVSCKDSGEERSHVLKVYNWADYIDEDVLAEFPAWYKQQTGEDIRLIYQVFDINEIMLTKIERGHEDFDVVCPSEYIIERMLKKDLLLPIDRNFGKTPDYLPNISPYIRRELNKTSQPGRTTTDYAVPYMWGTAGILYNRNFITPDEAGSWHCLWNPRNKGKILMKDSYREEDVVRAWPALTALAWPRPQYPDEKRGVLELVTALENGLSFEDWPQAVAEGLREGIGRAAAAKKDLEEALFQWEPRKANELSETLEEELATLNERAPKP